MATRSDEKDNPIVGYCHYHDTQIDLDTFAWKGCWTCHHFDWSDFPFLTVDEACKIYGVSRKTIYRWIKAGKLEASLLEMGRGIAAVPRRIYVIQPSQPRPPTRRRKRTVSKKNLTRNICF